MKKGVDFTGVTTAFYCHDGGGNLLMHKRSRKCRDEQGNWDVGSGSLDFGLSPEENLKKEIKEEYCAEVKDFKLLGVRNIHRKLTDGTPTHWIAFEYLVLVDRNQVKMESRRVSMRLVGLPWIIFPAHYIHKILSV